MHLIRPSLLALLALLAACGEQAGPPAQAGADGRTANPGDNAGNIKLQQRAELALGRTEPYGTHLVGAGGRALYALGQDQPGRSVCYGACERAWPPLLSPRPAVQAGAQLDDALIDTAQRNDGSTQVTYAGHPLYYYPPDAGETIAHGHGVADAWGRWYLVGADGRMLPAKDAPVPPER